MKIHRIINWIQSSVQYGNKRESKDLISFGVEQDSNTPDTLISKDAAIALKNKYMTKVSFKGVTENIENKGYVGTTGNIRLELTSNHGRLPHKNKQIDFDSPDKYYHEAGRLLIQKHDLWHPNSSIENTSSQNYREGNNRVYFADPEEIVNEQTKRDHDFIVYDNRPKYPWLNDVKENYFNDEQNAKDYGLWFKTIAEYYNRLEKADKRELQKLESEKDLIQKDFMISQEYKDYIETKKNKYPWEVEDINEDKIKSDYFYDENKNKLDNINQKIGYYKDRLNFSIREQDKAIEAYKIFNEVGLMFMERDKLRSIVKESEWRIPLMQSSIENYTQTINKRTEEKNELEEQLKITKEWQNFNSKKLNKLQKNSDNDSNNSYYEKSREDKEKIKEAEEEIRKCAEKIRSLEFDIDLINEKLSKAQKSLKYEQNQLDNYTKTLPQIQELKNKKSEEIKTYYHKMEEFYKNNIDTWQCQ